MTHACPKCGAEDLVQHLHAAVCRQCGWAEDPVEATDWENLKGDLFEVEPVRCSCCGKNLTGIPYHNNPPENFCHGCHETRTSVEWQIGKAMGESYRRKE